MLQAGTRCENASHYKLSGYTALPTSGKAAKETIKNAISQGMPMPIRFEMHESFRTLNEATASNYSYLPGDDRKDLSPGGTR